MYLPIKDGRLFNRGVQSFPLKKPTKSGPFRHFFKGAATHYSKGTKKKLSSPVPAIFEGGRGRGGDKNGTSSLACEQALLFGRVKRVSQKHVSERRSREGQRKAPFPGPSLVRSHKAHFTCPNRRAFSQATSSWQDLNSSTSTAYDNTFQVLLQAYLSQV